MVGLIVAMVALAAGGPVLFLGPEALGEARGVELRAQAPLETQVLMAPEAGAELWHMPVAALPLEGKTGIWYQRVDKGQKEYLDQRVLCLGLYKDGEWELRKASDEPVPWGGVNNVVMRRSPYTPTWGGFNQHQIVRVDDGFRMLFWDQPTEQGEAGAMLASSPDGIRWEKDTRGAVFTEHNDALTLLPKDGGYLLFQTMLEDWPDKPYKDNLAQWRRVQCLRESKDLVAWSPQEVLLRPDAQDPPETEFYLMKAFPYGGQYLGILMKYFGDPGAANKHSSIIKNELIVSKDARHWERPFRGTDIGFFSFADPFMDGDKRCFASWQEGAIALFKYRPNRLVGVTAEGEGEFLTPELGFAKPVLDVDASKGKVEVVPVDAEGKALAEPAAVEGRDEEAWAVGDVEGTYRLKVRLWNATVFGVREQ